jgi:hypothetical protein
MFGHGLAFRLLAGGASAILVTRHFGAAGSWSGLWVLVTSDKVEGKGRI